MLFQICMRHFSKYLLLKDIYDWYDIMSQMMTENPFLNTIPLITEDTLTIITFLISLFLFTECKVVF